MKDHNNQLLLFNPNNFVDQSPNLSLGKHGTFSPNIKTEIHRWYPYVEGFSSEFAKTIIEEFCDGQHIYDPFAGTGTTITVATRRNMYGYYSEINPFMRLVIRCKTNNFLYVCREHEKLKQYLENLVDYSENNLKSLIEAEIEINKCFPHRNYFTGTRLIEVIAIKEAIEK